MRFEMKRSVAGAAAADPDPRAAPGDVPDAALMRCPLTIRNSDTVPGRLLLTAEGTTANTFGVEIWVLDDTGLDRGAGLPDLPSQSDKANRQWYNCTPGGALTVTVGEVIEFSAVMPAPGTMYVRVTTAPAAAGVLKVAAAA